MSRVGMPQANSMTSRPRWTSPRASDTTLPCSSEIDLGELLDVGVHQLAEREQDLRALRQRRLPPALERGFGGAHGGVDVVDARQRHLGLLGAGGGVPDRARALRGPGCRLAADPVRDGPQRTSSWRLVFSTVLVRGRRGSIAWPFPQAADPGVRGVVADVPGALGVRARHHVEVVEVVAGCGHRRSVPAVRDEDRVAGADLGANVDLLARPGAVDPLEPAGGCVALRGGRVGLEVVDLLQARLARTLPRRACAAG